MVTHRTLRVGILLSCMLAVPSAAGAQDVATDEARGAFQAGQAAYRAGRFPEALTYFQRAYELTQEPDVLYNVATVHERLRHDREALDAYRHYLEARPESQDRANIEARIAVLEEALTETPTGPLQSSPESATERPAIPDSGEQEHAVRDPDRASTEPTVRAAGAGPGPWVLIGIAAATVVASVALLASAQLDIDAVANGTAWDEIRDAHDRVPLLSGFGFALGGIGVALLAGGVSWLAIGDADHAQVALSPNGAWARCRF